MTQELSAVSFFCADLGKPAEPVHQIVNDFFLVQNKMSWRSPLSSQYSR